MGCYPYAIFQAWRRTIGAAARRLKGGRVALTEAHLMELRAAKARLETVPFHIQLSNVVGAPIEFVYGKLPLAIQSRIGDVTGTVLNRALLWTAGGLKSGESRPARNGLHKASVAALGAAGGFFGLPGATAEVPATTMMMLRSIAEIARENGEDVGSERTRLECLSVLAMGGRSRADDATESAYFATRAAQAQMISSASNYLESAARSSGKRAAEEAVPVLVRLINEVARRLGVTVSRTVAAKIVPAVGAVTGAAINTLFLDYYQGVAAGHFTLRRLERLYGDTTVRAAYEAMRA